MNPQTLRVRIVGTSPLMLVKFPRHLPGGCVLYAPRRPRPKKEGAK